jgi:hypothetical protein
MPPMTPPPTGSARRALLLLPLLLLLAGCGTDGGERPPLNGNGGETPTYAEGIAPILSAGCSCHQPGGAEYSRVRLDTYQRVYVLRDRVQLRAGVQGSMPPTGALPQAQRQTIIAWYEGGSPP